MRSWRQKCWDCAAAMACPASFTAFPRRQRPWGLRRCICRCLSCGRCRRGRESSLPCWGPPATAPQKPGRAEALGCTYITAGHVFDTDCKKGLPGRGLPFLEEVCGSVSIPVYAIGGIHEDNVAAVRRSGAQGACVMSTLMQCQDPAACLQNLRQRAARSCM